MSGRYGVVVSFDEERGLGEVRGADGTTWPFHCTSIADGSRTIAVGARVRFEPLARFGRDEAGSIEPVEPVGPVGPVTSAD